MWRRLIARDEGKRGFARLLPPPHVLITRPPDGRPVSVPAASLERGATSDDVRRAFIFALGILTSCAEPEAATERPGEPCEIVSPVTPLAGGLAESSGAAVSGEQEGLVWTHNDSGWPAQLFAVDLAGAIVGTVTVHGAENVDWEDVALARCAAGDCLYVGDIGDNDRKREEIAVYRLPEPRVGSPGVRGVERFAMRYPDGAHDAEALFVLPGEEVYVVTKGDRRPALLFRYPGALRGGETVTLELVATLSEGPLELLERFTAGDASPDGEWVVLRSYQEVRFHRAAELLAGNAAPALRFSLQDVEEVQGEGVSFGPDGSVVLTGEGGFEDAPGTIAVLRCRLP